MAESTTDKNKTQGASQPQQKKSGRSGGNRRPRQGQGRPAKKATPAQAAKAQNSRLPSEKQLKANTTRAQKQSDAYLLSDLLATEKYVSGVYNTAVFEFNDPAARQVLSALQQQEQCHGKELAAYMQANGMSC